MIEEKEPKTFFFKKMSLGFLITTIIGVSINNGILALSSTFYYYNTGFPLFEVINYLFLSLFLLVCPILTLFFLDSIHVRRILRLYCFGMLITNIGDLIHGINHFSTIFDYGRPWNTIFILVESIALLICWIFILRQIRGKSLLPIPVKTERIGFFSWIKNLKNFIFNPARKNKKLVNVVILINIVFFIGIFATMLPENTEITLERPENHDMKISFWASRSTNFDNETLNLLGQNNVEIYGWFGHECAYRYAEHDIPVYKIANIPDPKDQDRLDTFYQQIDDYMDWADAQPEQIRNNLRGFISNFEILKSIARYDSESTYYRMKNNSEVIDYVHSRGFEYMFCNTLHNIGDLYDGDNDIDVVYDNPFHPVHYQNLTNINWMVYRSEQAIFYDEPHAYKTHQWARYTTEYMHFLEDKYGFERSFWSNKAGFSIGVSSDQLYTYNAELRGDEVSLNELILDAQICHANEIGQVTVFFLRFFMNQWGYEGLERFINEINNYETVSFQYKRRGSFFGNLKWAGNMTGSVFGFFFLDGLYSSWFLYIGIIWMVLLLVVPLIFAFQKIPDDSKNYIGKNGDESEIEREKDKKSTILRLLYFTFFSLIMVWTFIIAEIFFVNYEIVQWLPIYWENVIMAQDGFPEIWQSVKTQYLPISAIIIAIIFSLSAILVKKWDKKREMNQH